mmetsp:Transcript_107879/g.343825  ORF Transcript_107879/g.343825 Transcript_107879/m.343825 type:complete len:237 (+) Transcript_107879:229-939(+)
MLLRRLLQSRLELECVCASGCCVLVPLHNIQGRHEPNCTWAPGRHILFGDACVHALQRELPIAEAQACGHVRQAPLLAANTLALITFSKPVVQDLVPPGDANEGEATAKSHRGGSHGDRREHQGHHAQQSRCSARRRGPHGRSTTSTNCCGCRNGHTRGAESGGAIRGGMRHRRGLILGEHPRRCPEALRQVYGKVLAIAADVAVAPIAADHGEGMLLHVLNNHWPDLSQRADTLR